MADGGGNRAGHAVRAPPVAATIALTGAAVAALAWRGRPRWLPAWLLLEAMFICFAGDLVWQFVQAVQARPVPVREPVGWGLGYVDFDAAVSFGSQATGWSHAAVAVVGAAAAAIYAGVLAAVMRRAWRRGGRAPGRIRAGAAAR